MATVETGLAQGEEGLFYQHAVAPARARDLQEPPMLLLRPEEPTGTGEAAGTRPVVLPACS